MPSGRAQTIKVVYQRISLLSKAVILNVNRISIRNNDGFASLYCKTRLHSRLKVDVPVLHIIALARILIGIEFYISAFVSHNLHLYLFQGSRGSKRSSNLSLGSILKEELSEPRVPTT